MQLQLINFSQHHCGFILQSRALCRIIFRGILARAVLEIQIAKIVIQNIFLLVQKIKPRLGDLPRGMPLWIEDEGKDREEKNSAGYGAHICVSRRMRSRVAAKAAVSGTAGMGTVRNFQLRTISKTPAMPRKSITGGMIQAK